MYLTSALDEFHKYDQKGRYVYLTRDLRSIFRLDSHSAFRKGIDQLVLHRILIRAARGVYVFGYSRHKNSYKTIELIAIALRRGFYSYVSLESALSEYGIISQIPISRITIMTTGSNGLYKTPFGEIEFTHTKRTVRSIIDSVTDVGRPLKMATPTAALRDLKRVGRNTHLIDEDVLLEC